MYINNIAFVNGNGSYGGAISTKAKELVLDKCIFKDNTAYMGSGLFGYGGNISILNSTFNSNIAIRDTVSMPYGGKLVLKSTEIRNSVGAKEVNCLFFIGDSGQHHWSPEEELMYRQRSKEFLEERIRRLLEKESMYRQKPAEVLGEYSRGIYDKYLELIINNCTFHDNILEVGSPTGSDVVAVGNILIANSEFRSNYGVRYSGALLVRGDSVVIANTNIINNTVTDRGPAAGLKVDGGNVLLHNCSISGNHYAKDGMADCGGIKIYEDSSVEVIDSTIADNEGFAGGLYAESNTTVLVKNCMISENSGSGKGGAIYNKGIMTLNESKILKNTAEEYAGAIFNSGSLIINGGLISENVASRGEGGAIKTTGSLELNGVDIYSNHAYGGGGAIYNEGIMSLKGCSVSKNTPDDIYDPSSITSRSRNG